MPECSFPLFIHVNSKRTISKAKHNNSNYSFTIQIIVDWEFLALNTDIIKQLNESMKGCFYPGKNPKVIGFFLKKATCNMILYLLD